MVFQFSNSVRSIFDPGDPMCRSHSTLQRESRKKFMIRSLREVSSVFAFKNVLLFLSSRAEMKSLSASSRSIFDSRLIHFIGPTVDILWGGRLLETYILSISGFSPCIFPMIVPFFEFFTQPLMPAFMQLSRQNFVNPTPSQRGGGNETTRLSPSLQFIYLEHDQTPQNHTEPTSLCPPCPFP